MAKGKDAPDSVLDERMKTLAPNKCCLLIYTVSMVQVVHVKVVHACVGVSVYFSHIVGMRIFVENWTEVCGGGNLVCGWVYMCMGACVYLGKKNCIFSIFLCVCSCACV